MSYPTPGYVPGIGAGDIAGVPPVSSYVTGPSSGGTTGLYPSYGSGYGAGIGLGYPPSMQPFAPYTSYNTYTPYSMGSYYTHPYLYQPQQYPYTPYGTGWSQPGTDTATANVPWGQFSYEDMRPADPHEGGPERPEERPPHAEHIDWSARYPNHIVLRGPARKEVALTFDDGPDDEWTPKVLDQLAEVNVKATFFIFGRRAERFPDVLRRMMQEGHVLGNHTWSHPNLTKLTAPEVRSQIEQTDAVIRRVTGKTPALFRPPYGAINDIVVKEVIRLKKKIIFWNVDSLDWMELNARQVAANILSHAHPGSIILQHSAGGTGENLQGTVDAIPIVVNALRSRGYKFRTIPQLLGIRAYQP